MIGVQAGSRVVVNVVFDGGRIIRCDKSKIGNYKGFEDGNCGMIISFIPFFAALIIELIPSIIVLLSTGSWNQGFVRIVAESPAFSPMRPREVIPVDLHAISKCVQPINCDLTGK